MFNKGKILKGLLITLMLFSFSAYADSIDMIGSSNSLSRPLDVDVSFDESTFNTQPWTQEFRYVVVVDKSNFGIDSQTIKVFEYGKLIITDKVSTGRDAFESAGEHGSKMDSWTVTPTGYYTPEYLDKDHKSGAYGGKWSWLKGGVKMPFAIFFNGGIALHERPNGTESMLGKKASGGCVRLSDTLASDLFLRVQETQGSRNPRFNVNGTPVLDAQGQLVHSTNTGFSTLIIVQNKIKE